MSFEVGVKTPSPEPRLPPRPGSSASSPSSASASTSPPSARRASPSRGRPGAVRAAQLRALELIAVPAEEYRPRRDMVNGAAGDAGLAWHDGPNTLPEDAAEPYFVANNRGPAYLNAESGYKVVQPLVTAAQTGGGGGDFTMGTIIMSPKLDNETATSATLLHPFALELQESQLIFSVDGYETASLLQGDVGFVPGNTSFSFHATVPLTKFMYMNGGGEGLDEVLLKKSIPWGFPAYPRHAGFQVDA